MNIRYFAVCAFFLMSWESSAGLFKDYLIYVSSLENLETCYVCGYTPEERYQELLRRAENNPEALSCVIKAIGEGDIGQNERPIKDRFEELQDYSNQGNELAHKYELKFLKDGYRLDLTLEERLKILEKKAEIQNDYEADAIHSELLYNKFFEFHFSGVPLEDNIYFKRLILKAEMGDEIASFYINSWIAHESIYPEDCYSVRVERRMSEDPDFKKARIKSYQNEQNATILSNGFKRSLKYLFPLLPVQGYVWSVKNIFLSEKKQRIKTLEEKKKNDKSVELLLSLDLPLGKDLCSLYDDYLITKRYDKNGIINEKIKTLNKELEEEKNKIDKIKKEKRDLKILKISNYLCISDDPYNAFKSRKQKLLEKEQQLEEEYTILIENEWKIQRNIDYNNREIKRPRQKEYLKTLYSHSPEQFKYHQLVRREEIAKKKKEFIANIDFEKLCERAADLSGW
ncbi:MAG: hypothetical protein Q8L85_07290 [Alphaproteobacteria bacterium]|nr:hypothetical protein [Alphaproteobacteria bacterium]